MVKKCSHKYVHVMVLRHEWLSEARAEFEATLDYVRQEFGNRIVERTYVH